MSLADFFGPQFERCHPEGCTCPPPVLPKLEFTKIEDHLVNRGELKCLWCGLVIYPRKLNVKEANV